MADVIRNSGTSAKPKRGSYRISPQENPYGFSLEHALLGAILRAALDEDPRHQGSRTSDFRAPNISPEEPRKMQPRLSLDWCESRCGYRVRDLGAEYYGPISSRLTRLSRDCRMASSWELL